MADIVIGAAGPRSLARPKSSSLASAALKPRPYGQENVRGLQIAVDDAGAVRFVERIGDVDADLQHLLERQRPLGVSHRSASVSPSRYSMTR